MTADALPALLVPQQLAALLGLKPHTVAEWARKGSIPAAKVGRCYVIRREALLAFLELQERRDRPDPARFLRSLPGRRRRRSALGPAVAPAAPPELPAHPHR